MSLLSRLFGGPTPQAPESEPEIYKDFRIFAEPIKEGGGFRVAARIEKETDGRVRSHHMVRADTCDYRRRGARGVDEQGEDADRSARQRNLRRLKAAGRSRPRIDRECRLARDPPRLDLPVPFEEKPGRKERPIQTSFTVDTRGPGLTEITRPIADWVEGAGVAEGLFTLFVRHTSCSLLIQENADPSARADLETFLGRLIPQADDPAQGWITHRAEGPDDMPAHIKAALLPVSLSIPVSGGRLALGTWQGIYLWEHRTHSHRREVAAHLA